MVETRFDLLELSPDEILVSERLVELREEHVWDLAEHIERSRFVQPILAVRLRDPVNGAGYRLIAGRHRTEACRILDWKVPALVAAEEDLAEGEERLLEALENSGRLVLTHAQRVRHEQIVLRYYEDQLGRPLNREERAQRVADAAKRNGVGKAYARQLVNKAEVLSPEILDAARGTALDNARGLDLLASMTDDDARLNRIEKEKQRATERAEQARPQQDSSRQAAGWVREILQRGLGRQEISQIAQILPLTSIRHLREALEDAGTGGH
jgi:ParB-like chromosome segregation protein Spo0J